MPGGACRLQPYMTTGNRPASGAPLRRCRDFLAFAQNMATGYVWKNFVKHSEYGTVITGTVPVAGELCVRVRATGSCEPTLTKWWGTAHRPALPAIPYVSG